MQDAISRFERWFRDNGGYIHPSVEFHSTGEAGFSLRLKTNSSGLPADAAIISCPHSLSLSSMNAYSLSPQFHPLKVQLPGEILDRATPRIIAALSLCAERLLGDQSFWFDYVNVLPGIPSELLADPNSPKRGCGEVDTPLWWSDAERSWLQNTNVERGMDELHESWTLAWREWETIVTKWAQENSLGTLNWHVFKWAMTILGSRSFSSSILRHIDIDAKPLLDTHNPHSLLYPGIDLLNHSTTTGNRWDADVESLTVVCHDKPSALDEIWNTYGSQANSQLLLSWGFAIPNSKEDTFALRLLATTDTELLDIISATKTNLGKRSGSSTIKPTAEDGVGGSAASKNSQWETTAFNTQLENENSRLSQQMTWPPPTADQAGSRSASVNNNMFFVRLPSTQSEDKDDWDDEDEYPPPNEPQSRGFYGFPEALLSRLAAQVVSTRERQRVVDQPNAFSRTKLYKQLGPRNQLAVADLLEQKVVLTLQSMTHPSKWAASDGSSRGASRRSQALIYHRGQARILQANLEALRLRLAAASTLSRLEDLPDLSTLKQLFTFMQTQVSSWNEFRAGFSGVGDVGAITAYIDEQGAEDLFMMLAVGAIAIAAPLLASRPARLPLHDLTDYYTTRTDNVAFPWDPADDVQNMQTYVSDMRARCPESALWASHQWDEDRFVRGIALLVMVESLEIERGGKREIALCTGDQSWWNK